MPLVVAVLVVVRDVLVLVLEGTPTVEIVPEVVKVLDLLLRAVVVAKFWDRLVLGGV